jgi:hypothetical protein
MQDPTINGQSMLLRSSISKHLGQSAPPTHLLLSLMHQMMGSVAVAAVAAAAAVTAASGHTS